jgi:L-ascorbate metabolism protein UlaG (beta-lactamase superfamily)
VRITWLGHSGFRIEIGGQRLLVDPWLAGNPMFPADRREEAVAGATAVLVTHGHGDHAADAPGIARALGIPLAGKYDLVSWLEATQGCTAIGFNNGGTIGLGDVAVTMVAASHSSSVASDQGPVYAGGECGYMIAAGGRTVYVSGDTDVMADMGLWAELHRPEIGILACGGHYTMDMRRAAFAARRFFDFRTVIPCHYRTFPVLAQSARPLAEALPGVKVIEPAVLVPIDL